MADFFRVPMEVIYAIEGGEPALMASDGGTFPVMILLRRAGFPDRTLMRLRMGPKK